MYEDLTLKSVSGTNITRPLEGPIFTEMTSGSPLGTILLGGRIIGALPTLIVLQLGERFRTTAIPLPEVMRTEQLPLAVVTSLGPINAQPRVERVLWHLHQKEAAVLRTGR